jgi:hypothetical protein
MQVLRNSTFILPLAYAPAFGNEISAAEGIEDRQRGDLVVAICPPEDPYCLPPAQPPSCPDPPEPLPGVYLTTRYATSVMPHPASTAGLRGYLDFANYFSNWGLTGQDLAVLEVPSSACPGTYELSVRSRDLVPPYTEHFVTAGVDIVVLDAPIGVTNPSTANPFGFGDIDIDADLADLVPNPTVPIQLTQKGWIESFPAAVELEIAYPSTRVEILGAYQDKQLGIRSLIRWRDDHAGKVTLSVVDPERCTVEFRLVFRLLDGQPPVDPFTDHFRILQQRSYDLNGALLTGNTYAVWESGGGESYCPES